jgi:protein-L-isoaspartate(D-aspartate) O-methyltransferase
MRLGRLFRKSDDNSGPREEMVRTQIEARGITDAPTLAAMRAVPREAFVPDHLRDHAYDDQALPIGYGQTISQPYIVAVMTAALGYRGENSPEHAPTRLLDVGTGSGYQAAVLAQLGAQVTTIERDPAIAAAARERLARLGYDIEVVVGDGSSGYPDRAPFSGIVVGAGVPAIPDPLIDQLADGGRLVIPIGPREGQHLTILERRRLGTTTRTADEVVFVPLLGEHGYRN